MTAKRLFAHAVRAPFLAIRGAFVLAVFLMLAIVAAIIAANRWLARTAKGENELPPPEAPSVRIHARIYEPALPMKPGEWRCVCGQINPPEYKRCHGCEQDRADG